MSTIEIQELSQYITIITGYFAKLENNLLHQDKLFFRGHDDVKYKITPSIARCPEPSIHNSLLWLERDLVNEAIRKRPDIFNEEEYPLNLLTKLQHFGIPTRLLDVTLNPLIALYFACLKYECDGEVIVFLVNNNDIHSNVSPVANAIAYYSRQGNPISFDHLIKIVENERFFKGFSFDFVKESFKDREGYLSALQAERFSEPLFVFPLELSERQKRQQGAFIIFPNNDTGEIDCIEKHEKLIKSRITIKLSNKQSILKELSYYGITSDYLFPDSIDVLGEAIKESAKKLFKDSL